MKNIHVLPTDKPSRLYYNSNQKHYRFNFNVIRSSNCIENQNIYITSDEEIKDNDYITDGYLVWKWKDDSSLLGRKKIILTTDQDLIKDGVQAIDDEFLEWFVKNPNCEEVEVEINSYMDKNISDSITFTDYKIIIPKEEPKQICEYCKIEITKYGCGCGTEKPKQETLEEVAKSHAIYELENNYKPTKESFKLACKRNFIRGAKWQQEPEQFFNDDRVKTLEKGMEYLLKKQERMYSEEDLREAFTQGMENMDYCEMYGWSSKLTEQQWFEQFKNK